MYLTEIQAGLEEIRNHDLDSTQKQIAFHQIMVNAQKKSNKAYPKAKLRTLWDCLGVPEMGAHTSYVQKFIPNEDGSETDVYAPYWKNYVINAAGKLSIFKQKIRIQLVLSRILRQIDLTALKHNKVIQDFFPLHNHWQLFGEDSQETKSDLEGAKVE